MVTLEFGRFGGWFITLRYLQISCYGPVAARICLSTLLIPWSVEFSAQLWIELVSASIHHESIHVVANVTKSLSGR